MIRMPVTVEQMGHVMNILPFQTVGDVFRSIKKQIDTGKKILGPLRAYLPFFRRASMHMSHKHPTRGVQSAPPVPKKTKTWASACVADRGLTPVQWYQVIPPI